jgi:hypothetical protein
VVRVIGTILPGLPSASMTRGRTASLIITATDVAWELMKLKQSLEKRSSFSTEVNYCCSKN